MKIFLAGGESRHWILDEMKIYLAGQAPWRETGLYEQSITKSRPYILESFFYANEDTERLMPVFGDFLLDSGAFTFMTNQKKKADWNEYIKKYADFINRNKVEKFFELDIDSVVGYKQVLEYREKLQELAGRKCIPVWHKSRGADEWKRMCKEFDYVAIGGIVSGEIKKPQYPAFTNMLNIAHDNGAKVHGLGFTSLDGIVKYKFDSVDSTAWTTGNRFGFIYYFDGKTMKKVDVPKGKRLKGKQAALHNFTEWVKFQRYADKNL